MKKVDRARPIKPIRHYVSFLILLALVLACFFIIAQATYRHLDSPLLFEAFYSEQYNLVITILAAMLGVAVTGYIFTIGYLTQIETISSAYRMIAKMYRRFISRELSAICYFTIIALVCCIVPQYAFQNTNGTDHEPVWMHTIFLISIALTCLLTFYTMWFWRSLVNPEHAMRKVAHRNRIEMELSSFGRYARIVLFCRSAAKKARLSAAYGLTTTGKADPSKRISSHRPAENPETERFLMGVSRLEKIVNRMLENEVLIPEPFIDEQRFSSYLRNKKKNLKEVDEFVREYYALLEYRNYLVVETSDFGMKKNLEASMIEVSKAFIDLLNLVTDQLKNDYLRGENISNVTLGDVDLSNAAINGTKFTGSYLRGASFRGARSNGAEFKNCDLTKTDLREADMEGAYFSDCKMANVQLTRSGQARSSESVLISTETKLSGCSFRASNLPNMQIESNGEDEKRFDFSKTSFEKANLKSLKLTYVDCRSSIFHDVLAFGSVLDACLFDNSDFSDAILTASRIKGCSIDQTTLEGAKLPASSLIESSFFKSSLAKANLTDVHAHSCCFEQANLGHVSALSFKATTCHFDEATVSNSDFTYASFIDCSFSKADLHSTVFKNTLIKRCSLRHADLRAARFGNATLENCIFEYADFRQSTWRDLKVSNGIFSHANLSGASFVETTFYRCSELDHVLMDGCTFIKCDFIECDISEQKLIERGAIVQDCGYHG